jgi:hypothetical protein
LLGIEKKQKSKLAETVVATSQLDDLEKAIFGGSEQQVFIKAERKGLKNVKLPKKPLLAKGKK